MAPSLMGAVPAPAGPDDPARLRPRAELARGSIAGIVVGCVVFVFLVLLCGYPLVVRCRRRRREKSSIDEGSGEDLPPPPPPPQDPNQPPSRQLTRRASDTGSSGRAARTDTDQQQQQQQGNKDVGWSGETSRSAGPVDSRAWPQQNLFQQQWNMGYGIGVGMPPQQQQQQQQFAPGSVPYPLQTFDPSAVAHPWAAAPDSAVETPTTNYITAQGQNALYYDPLVSSEALGMTHQPTMGPDSQPRAEAIRTMFNTFFRRSKHKQQGGAPPPQSFMAQQAANAQGVGLSSIGYAPAGDAAGPSSWSSRLRTQQRPQQPAQPQQQQQQRSRGQPPQASAIAIALSSAAATPAMPLVPRAAMAWAEEGRKSDSPPAPAATTATTTTAGTAGTVNPLDLVMPSPELTPEEHSLKQSPGQQQQQQQQQSYVQQGPDQHVPQPQPQMPSPAQFQTQAQSTGQFQTQTPTQFQRQSTTQSPPHMQTQSQSPSHIQRQQQLLHQQLHDQLFPEAKQQQQQQQQDGGLAHGLGGVGGVQDGLSMGLQGLDGTNRFPVGLQDLEGLGAEGSLPSTLPQDLASLKQISAPGMTDAEFVQSLVASGALPAPAALEPSDEWLQGALADGGLDLLRGVDLSALGNMALPNGLADNGQISVNVTAAGGMGAADAHNGARHATPEQYQPGVSPVGSYISAHHHHHHASVSPGVSPALTPQNGAAGAGASVYSGGAQQVSPPSQHTPSPYLMQEPVTGQFPLPLPQGHSPAHASPPEMPLAQLAQQQLSPQQMQHLMQSPLVPQDFADLQQALQGNGLQQQQQQQHHHHHHQQALQHPAQPTHHRYSSSLTVPKNEHSPVPPLEHQFGPGMSPQLDAAVSAMFKQEHRASQGSDISHLTFRSDLSGRPPPQQPQQPQQQQHFQHFQQQQQQQLSPHTTTTTYSTSPPHDLRQSTSPALGGGSMPLEFGGVAGGMDMGGLDMPLDLGLPMGLGPGAGSGGGGVGMGGPLGPMGLPLDFSAAGMMDFGDAGGGLGFDALGGAYGHHMAVQQPSPRMYTCRKCDKDFDQYHKLNHHMRYHDKNHACTYPNCGKSFGTKTHLQRHVNDIHERAKKYHCTEAGCAYSKTGGRSFPRKDNLRRHLLNIHQVVPMRDPEVEMAAGRDAYMGM